MSQAPAAAVDVPSRVRIAVDAIQDRKALGLQVLELGEISEFTDYFLLSTGGSERQVRAIADAVIEQLKEQEGLRALHVEGYDHGQWVLLDYGDFLVHIFTEPLRDYYRLDRLWADAPDVTTEFV